jgi:hypothetical protein
VKEENEMSEPSEDQHFEPGGASESQPPKTGPDAVVMAVNPDQVPMALPRDFPSKLALMIARLPGTRNARANTLNRTCDHQLPDV